MKIISYNVNGVRAALKKGLLSWLKQVDADVVCFQEIKALEEQVDLNAFRELGYLNIYWSAARKKGYSGTAILSKVKSNHTLIGCEIDIYDAEGRVITLDFADFSLMNVYFPSGSSGQMRQAFKMQWLDDFYLFIQKIIASKPNLLMCGDFNICHKAIDIHNPVSNKKSSGFLPEERAWLDRFLDLGFIDTFRLFNPDPHHYTWWSMRPGVRDRNLGWRIDYHMSTENMKNRIKRSVILKEAKHSDHCPILLEINE
ncbi:MAG: exodeoxyribonuclease III [Candidatus Cyclobacteriaceae bacterium M3_2C_046]